MDERICLDLNELDWISADLTVRMCVILMDLAGIEFEWIWLDLGGLELI